MTREEWTKLSSKKKRIKIAKCIGWKWVDRLEDIIMGIPPGSTQTYSEIIPDYLNDLNAMHKAVISQLGPAAPVYQHRYFVNLKELTHAYDMPPDASRWVIHNATAAQRAEAFVLTMDGSR